MKKTAIGVIAVALFLAGSVRADVMSLRQYVQTITQPAGYPTQTGNELWQFRVANAQGTGSLLPPGSGYRYPSHPNMVPLTGALYNIGNGGVLDSAIDGVFAHPGIVSLGIVLRIANDNTLIESLRVLADMVDNGHLSNGIGLSVYTNINSVVSQVGSRVVYSTANTTPYAEFLFPVNQVFNTGDRIEFNFDRNGSELYDHSVVDIQITIPEPASLVLLCGALPMLLSRRFSCSRVCG